MKYIEVEVSKAGDVAVEAFGFEGTTCLAATKEIEAAIGKITKDTKKSHASTVPQKAIQR